VIDPHFDIRAARALDAPVASAIVAVFLMGSQARGEPPAAACRRDTDCCVVVDETFSYDRLSETVRAGMTAEGRLEVCPRTVAQMAVSRKFTFDLCVAAVRLYLRAGADDPTDSIPRPLRIPDNDIGGVLMAAIEQSSFAVRAVHDTWHECVAVLAAEKSLLRLGEYWALESAEYPAPRTRRNELLIDRHPDLARSLKPLASLRSAQPASSLSVDDAVSAVVLACARELRLFMRKRGLNDRSVSPLLADPEHREFAKDLVVAFPALAAALENDATCLRGSRGREFAAKYRTLIEANDGLTFKPPVVTEEGYHVFK
jgi:hypothetical protein